MRSSSVMLTIQYDLRQRIMTTDTAEPWLLVTLSWQVKVPTSGEDNDVPYIFVCFMLSVWYAKHPPIAFVFKSLDSPLQIRHQTSIELSHRVWQTKINSFNFCWTCYTVLSNSSLLGPNPQSRYSLSLSPQKTRGGLSLWHSNDKYQTTSQTLIKQ